jgi:hypothetical protein
MVNDAASENSDEPSHATEHGLLGSWQWIINLPCPLMATVTRLKCMITTLRVLVVAMLPATLCGCDASTSTQAPTVARTDEVHWYDFSIGVVDRHYEGGVGHHGRVTGDGSYVTIRDGEDSLDTTGGWYYQLGLQLPLDVATGDVIFLTPASPDRHFERVGDFYNVGFLKPSEFVAFRYGSPTGAFMACGDPESFATVRINHIDRERVAFHLTLHASIPIVHGVDVGDIDIDTDYEMPRNVMPDGEPCGPPERASKLFQVATQTRPAR